MRFTWIPRYRWIHRLFLCMAIAGYVFLSGCSPAGYRFADRPPVTRLDDRRPVPVPQATEYQGRRYAFEVLVHRPAVEGLKSTPSLPAMDVNALDEVPASSWFTPRLGYRRISPGELLAGPRKVGPPQLPLRVVKAKSGGNNPGFIVADARGELYLVKFDPPDFPALETATALVVNRLFWGFGYNVPEDYLLFFRREDVQVDPRGDLSPGEVDRVLRSVAAPVNGRYRATASLFLKGKILGPVPDRGVREDDPNDGIPHENRRVLRALRVFGAFVNHSDMRIDNSLDVYEGPPGKGHVVHYLLDFGEAFGGHGAEHDYLWDGFRHMFSFREVALNLLSLGLRVESWENLHYTPYRSVGAFEAEVFDPGKWKEVYPYAPIRASRPDDDYWAAKILGALTEEHIRALIEAAQYPEPGAAEYMVHTLMKRRRKVLEYFLHRVSPVEVIRQEGNWLHLEDRGRAILKDSSLTRYEVRFFDGKGRSIDHTQVISTGETTFRVYLSPALLQAANGYLRVDVWAYRRGHRLPRPAQFHFRGKEPQLLHLVGVVH